MDKDLLVLFKGAYGRDTPEAGQDAGALPVLLTWCQSPSSHTSFSELEHIQ